MNTRSACAAIGLGVAMALAGLGGPAAAAVAAPRPMPGPSCPDSRLGMPMGPGMPGMPMGPGMPGMGDRDPMNGDMMNSAMCDARSEFDYLAHMIPHHAEAVAAARNLARSERPEMRAFGARIVRTQSAEIEQMRGWLREWYPDRSTDMTYHPMMRDLSGLSGDELDKAFLDDMIPHHQHAVMMSQYLLRHGLAEHEEVAELARTIRDTQTQEIAQMREWRREWFSPRHPAPVGARTH